MGKTKIIFAILIWIAITSIEVKMLRAQDDTWTDLYMQVYEWIDHPDRFIVDMSPILLCPDFERFNGDFETLEKLYGEYTLKKCLDKEKDPGLKEAYKYYTSLRGDTLRATIVDMTTKTVAYALLFSPLLLMDPGSTKGLVMNGSKTMIQLSKFKILADFEYKDMKLLLIDGTRKYGFKHIYRGHCPKRYVELERLAPPSKTLFMSSSREDIVEVMKRVVRNAEVEAQVENYVVLRASVQNTYGITRDYRLVYDQTDGVIVSFYPTSRVPKEVAVKTGAEGYIKARYGD